jgi:hypothetical protein
LKEVVFVQVLHLKEQIEYSSVFMCGFTVSKEGRGAVKTAAFECSKNVASSVDVWGAYIRAARECMIVVEVATYHDLGFGDIGETGVICEDVLTKGQKLLFEHRYNGVVGDGLDICCNHDQWGGGAMEVYLDGGPLRGDIRI